MKKVILGLVALSAVTFASNNNNNNNSNQSLNFKNQGTYLNVSAGFDFAGEYDGYDGWDHGHYYRNNGETENFGGELAAEGMVKLNDMFHVGAGIALQSHRALDDHDWGGAKKDRYYNSVPVYGIGKLIFPVNGPVKPYLKGELGYSFNTEFNSHADVDNGLYYGLGGGVEYQNFTADLMYKTNEGDTNSWWGDADYTRWVLAVGYSFDLKR